MTFDPTQHLINLKGKDYLEVAWRLVWLREDWPHAVIETIPHFVDENRAVILCTVTAKDEEGQTVGVGSGMGACTAQQFNRYVEKAETTAIGRALGSLGYGTQFTDDFSEDPGGPDEYISEAPVQLRQQPPQRSSNNYAPAQQPQQQPPQQQSWSGQSQQQQRPQQGGGEPLTGPQRSKILGHVARGEINGDALAIIIRDHGQGAQDVDTLTKTAASRVIDTIMKGLGQQPR